MGILYCILSFLAGAALVALSFFFRLRAERSAATAALTEKTRQADEAANRVGTLEAENRALAARSEADRRETQLLRAQMADVQSRQKEQFETQLRVVEQRLQNVASQVLEHQSAQLREGNAEQLGHITAPLRETLGQLREALSRTDRQTAETKASLAEQLRQLMEANRQTTEHTQRLTAALRGDNKVQGNWGEVVLGDILESQGLQEGLHYDTQERLRDARGNALRHDETGAELQPDVVLHYPHAQDVVIDAKVSLKAYIDFRAAHDDATRTRCVDELVKSLREQARRLARKDYSSYIRSGRHAIDFVIMFVPNEGALQLALAHAPGLWNEAFQAKVLIAGEQNLLAVLHIIHIAWQQQQQAENQQRVFALADELVRRLGMFVERYERLGRLLADAQKQYDHAADKLYQGNQSVLKKGQELIALGARQDAKHKLPTEE